MTRGRTRRQHRALIVDDDPAAQEAMRAVCVSLGHEAELAGSVEEAEGRLRARRYCYVLLDVVLPPGPGLAPWQRAGVGLLRSLRQRATWSQLPVVVITGHGSEQVAVSAFKAGANDYARKPFEAEQDEPLDEKIRQALAFGCESRRLCPHMGGDLPGERTYDTRHRLHFLGDLKKGRALLELNGVPVWVQRNGFEILFRLAHEDREARDPDGWVHGRVLAPGLANHSLALGRLVADLEKQAGVTDLVQRDHKGRMRLCTPPDLVTWDAPAMIASDHGVLVKRYACA